MTLARTTLALIAVAAIAGCAGMAIDDRAFGLHKAGVFDDIEPTPFGFDSASVARMTPPAAGSGIPPMISHAIDDSIPITAARNDCLDCHDKPQNIGKPVPAGKARPSPASHYQGIGSGRPVLIGANYTCTSCHAPQANVPPLVRNESR